VSRARTESTTSPIGAISDGWPHIGDITQEHGRRTPTTRKEHDFAKLGRAGEPVAREQHADVVLEVALRVLGRDGAVERGANRLTDRGHVEVQRARAFAIEHDRELRAAFIGLDIEVGQPRNPA
jgi:hypothetical protein